MSPTIKLDKLYEKITKYFKIVTFSEYLNLSYEALILKVAL